MRTWIKATPILTVLLCAGLLGFAGAGCTGPLDSFNGDGGHPYPDAHIPADGGFWPDAAPPADASTGSGALVLLLIDLDGLPIPDATVVVDNIALGTTDALGYFCAQDLPANQPLLVSTKSETCSTTLRTVTLPPNVASSLRLTCVVPNVVQLADATLGGTVLGPNGFALELPPDSLYLEGALVSGPVDVRYAIVNSATAMAAAPGDMLSREPGPEIVPLESFGMVEVSFYQGGQRLTYSSVAEAVLSIPLTDTSSYTHGETIGLYSFDEQEGFWYREGAGTVDTQTAGAPVFVAYVSHFSWWNADVPLTDKGCITGRLVDGNGTPLVGANVENTGVDYLGGSWSHTDSSGIFCVDVKRDSLNSLLVWHVSDGASYFWLAPSVHSGASATDCTLGGCVDLGDQVVASATSVESCQ